MSKHVCNVCKTVLKEKASLERHMIYMHGEKSKRIPCPMCEERFRTKKQLKLHSILVHGQNLAKFFVCKKCGKAFENNKDLRIHMRSRDHNDEKPFVCDKCSKECTTEQNLALHKLFCYDIRNFPCELCSYTGHTENNLKVHMRSHSGERPYPCSLCDHSSITWTHAMAHNKTIHGGTGLPPVPNKKFVCKFPLCEASFLTDFELRMHSSKIHSADGQAAHKREEQRVANALDEHGFQYVREHKIETECSFSGSAYVKADFVMVFHNTVVLLEVDERQHEGYGVSCEIARMAKIVETLRLEGNEMRIVFVRYNPHDFRIDDIKHSVPESQKLETLVNFLRMISTEAIVPGACDVRLAYLFFDFQSDGSLSILEHPEYSEFVKEWVTWVMAPTSLVEDASKFISTFVCEPRTRKKRKIS